MKLLNVVYVKGDDWEGVYVLGKIWEQGHKVDWEDLLSKHVVHISEVKYADLDWLDDYGSLPDTLSEVQFTK